MVFRQTPRVRPKPCVRCSPGGIDVCSPALLVVLSLAVAFCNGCDAQKVGRSVLSTKLATREVKAAIDGGAFISSQEDDAIVTFRSGKLVVEKTRVLLDGTEVAAFPEDVTLVEVDSSAGTLTITADDKAVATVKLSK